MADREIGVGVIGFGLGGRVFQAPFVNAMSGLRLAAILQRHGGEAAKAYPAAHIVRVSISNGSMNMTDIWTRTPKRPG